MSADQRKQIGIRQGARSHQLKGGFMKQNSNFENSPVLKQCVKLSGKKMITCYHDNMITLSCYDDNVVMLS
jgi:hypothetical protein